MATSQYPDEIRFRCEPDLKRRLKRVAKLKAGPFAKYQAVARDAMREFVATEELRKEKQAA